ncbi:MAG: DUF1015 domain-containing protein [Clostridiales bacterium]|nr:MAG: DUF1015 domain-containing protein [Clostridiales bacterium]
MKKKIFCERKKVFLQYAVGDGNHSLATAKPAMKTKKAKK